MKSSVFAKGNMSVTLLCWCVLFVLFYVAESALMLDLWLHIRLGPRNSLGQE